MKINHKASLFKKNSQNTPWKLDKFEKSNILETFKIFAQAHEPISETRLRKGKGWRLFCSDWWEGAVFSPLIYGGNRSPELVEGNAEGAKLPHR